MIQQIEIDNFKSIRHADLELGKINLFIGENGAGKTNILEAIGVVSAAVYGVVDDESLLRRGVRPGVPRLYKTSNQKYKTGPHIHFSVRHESCLYSVSLLNPLKKPKPCWNFKTERLASDDLEKPYTRGVKRNPNPEMGGLPMILSALPKDCVTTRFCSDLRDYALYNPNTAALRGLVQDIQMRLPVGLAGGGLSEGLNHLLNLANKDEQMEEVVDAVAALFSWVREVSTSTHIGHILSDSVPRAKRTITFTDRYMKQDNNRLTAADASEGVLSEWIGNMSDTPQIVFCIPYISTETWAGALVFPESWGDVSEDCNGDFVSRRLVALGRPKAEKARRLVRQSGGQIKKVNGTYSRIGEYITCKGWRAVVCRYRQAEKFDNQLKESLIK